MFDSKGYRPVSAICLNTLEWFCNTFNGLRTWSTPSKSRLPNCSRKGSIFTQKPIARNDGISLLFLCDSDDFVPIGIRRRIRAGQEHGFVGG